MPYGRTPRALVTLPDVAVPSDSGRRLRSWSVLVGLSRHYELDVVLPLAGLPDRAHPMPPLATVRRSLALAPEERSSWRAGIGSVTQMLPWTLAHQDWRPVRSALEPWVAGQEYDLIWFGAVSHSVALRSTLRARRSVVDFDDVQTVKWEDYLRTRRIAGTSRLDRAQRRIELPLWRRIERTAARSVDTVVVADPGDVARCTTLGIQNARAVPNSYPDPGRLERSPGTSEPVVVFVANFAHDPNREAAQTLTDRVLPLLRESLPGTRLRLVGRSAELVADLAGRPGVDLVGPVSDVRPHLAGSIATLLPITYGGGTRLKALEAFALGVPVVSTDLGVTGLGATGGVHFLQASTPEQFVARTLELVDHPELAESLTTAARALYEQRFTTDASTEAIADLVAAIR